MHSLVCGFCSSDQRFARGLVGSPHPASFRFHLTMDTLAFGYTLPATGRIRDFHPLETCAARRTTTKGAVAPSDSSVIKNLYASLPTRLWIHFTHSTIGITLTARSSETPYSGRLMCSKPKAFDRKGNINNQQRQYKLPNIAPQSALLWLCKRNTLPR